MTLVQANRALLTNIYEHYCADIAGSVLKGASPGATSSGGGSAGLAATGGSVASRGGKNGASTRRRRLMSFEEALQMVRDFGISPQHINIQQVRRPICDSRRSLDDLGSAPLSLSLSWHVLQHTQLRDLWRACLEHGGANASNSAQHSRVSYQGFVDLLGRVAIRHMGVYSKEQGSDSPKMRLQVLLDIMNCAEGREKLLQDVTSNISRPVLTRGFDLCGA